MSRPDLRPARVAVVRHAPGAARTEIFLGVKQGVGAHGLVQQGPLILDARGRVLWFHPIPGSASPRRRLRPYANDVRVQRYRGRPVLTWWQGTAVRGHGKGVYVIVDEHYRRIATVRTAHGLDGDGHEFLLTPRGTALLTFYRRVPRDLSALGGPKRGFVLESGVQEVDVATGRVVFEWHSLGHVALSESYAPVPTTASGPPFDYFHVNAIAREPNGNLLVSARNTWTVYEISRATGRVLWRLGGKRSDFAVPRRARFAWQHDVRRHRDGTITLFDNGAAPPIRYVSRGLTLRLDRRARTVAFVRSLVHPGRILADSQGDVEALDGGHWFVGWGAIGRATEFGPQGHVLFDLRIRSPQLNSYRAFRFAWTGLPLTRPRVVARSGRGGAVTLYASWNGATDVRFWRVLAGRDERHLVVVRRRVLKLGFETAIRVRTRARVVVVQALAPGRRPLASAPPLVRVRLGWRAVRAR